MGEKLNKKTGWVSNAPKNSYVLTMKRTATLFALCLILSACSNKPSAPPAPSAQEKRNNFDACVIDWKLKNMPGYGDDFLNGIYLKQAQEQCVDLLR